MNLPLLWRPLAACCLVLATSAAAAQALNEPVTLVVGYAAGGSTDRAARVVAEHLGKKLGVAVTVDNRPGDGLSLIHI